MNIDEKHQVERGEQRVEAEMHWVGKENDPISRRLFQLAGICILSFGIAYSWSIGGSERESELFSVERAINGEINNGSTRSGSN